MKRIYLIGMAMIMISSAYGQKKESNFKSFDLSLSASFSDKGMFINFGGVGAKTKFGNCELNLLMLPSIRMSLEKNHPDYGDPKTEVIFRPTLGFGPQFLYKKWIFTTPIYYLFNNGQWSFTAGIGYVVGVHK